MIWLRISFVPHQFGRSCGRMYWCYWVCQRWYKLIEKWIPTNHSWKSIRQSYNLEFWGCYGVQEPKKQKQTFFISLFILIKRSTCRNTLCQMLNFKWYLLNLCICLLILLRNGFSQLMTNWIKKQKKTKLYLTNIIILYKLKQK